MAKRIQINLTDKEARKLLGELNTVLTKRKTVNFPHLAQLSDDLRKVME